MSDYDVTARRTLDSDIALLPFGRPIAGDPRIIALPGLQALYDQLARLGPGRLPVLIVGETGVGKTHLVDVLHEAAEGLRGRDPRTRRPFVRIDCAASSEPVFERDLADCEGTVLLDEVGELEPALQLQLLRALESDDFGRARELGAPGPRLVATSNKSLERAVEEGSFRRDLFHRLAGVCLVVPPLRTRPDDIFVLAEHFVRLVCRERKQVVATLGASARAALLAHPLPGNARELRHMIELGVLFADGGPIEAEHLSPPPLRVSAPERASLPDDFSVGDIGGRADRETLADAVDGLGSLTVPGTNTRLRAITRDDVIAALAACAGNQTLAATRLGMGRRTLSRWLDRLAIARPRKGAPALGQPTQPSATPVDPS